MEEPTESIIDSDIRQMRQSLVSIGTIETAVTWHVNRSKHQTKERPNTAEHSINLRNSRDGMHRLHTFCSRPFSFSMITGGSCKNTEYDQVTSQLRPFITTSLPQRGCVLASISPYLPTFSTKLRAVVPNLGAVLLRYCWHQPRTKAAHQQSWACRDARLEPHDLHQ